MKKYVFDSYALLAYCENETGADIIADIITRSLEDKAEIFVSVINWGEMYYIALREGGEDRAVNYIQTISKYPIKIIDADKELTLVAAKFKAHHKISYADAFAAGLAEQKKAVLVTGDKEFKQLSEIIKINFL
jgi:ribonuclease VapC